MIYLDNHTTTRLCKAAFEKLQEYQEDSVGTTLQWHQMGKESRNLKERYSPYIADFVGASLEEDSLVFYSSLSEAKYALIDTLRASGKTHYLTAPSEPFPVSISRTIPMNIDGKLDLEKLQAAISPKTALIAISWADPITGVIQPVEEIIEICKAWEIPLYVNASYILGKIPFSIQESNIDYLAFEGGMIHGPKSSAIMVAKKKQLPSSIKDIASFVALAVACQQANLFLDKMNVEIARLKHRLMTIAEPLFSKSPTLPNVVVIPFPGLWHERHLYFLDQKGVLATSAAVGVRLAGYKPDIANTSISFVLSRYTTEEEIEKVCGIITVKK